MQNSDTAVGRIKKIKKKKKKKKKNWRNSQILFYTLINAQIRTINNSNLLQTWFRNMYAL